MSKKKRRRGRKVFKNRPFYSKLIIPTKLYAKIRALTLEAKGEISGFGRTVVVPPDNVLNEVNSRVGGTAIKLEELEVFTQECHSSHTTLKKADLHTMYVEVARRDGNPENWNFWWHSHVHMDTGFSGEDDSTMTRLTLKDKKVVNDTEGLLVALCTNKRGDSTATIYKGGKRLMENLPIQVLSQVDDEACIEARQIIKDKVTFVREFDFRNVVDENYHFDPFDITAEDVKKYTKGMSIKKAKRFLKGVRSHFKDRMGI
jgi:hypothetical protein